MRKDFWFNHQSSYALPDIVTTSRFRWNYWIARYVGVVNNLANCIEIFWQWEIWQVSALHMIIFIIQYWRLKCWQLWQNFSNSPTFQSPNISSYMVVSYTHIYPCIKKYPSNSFQSLVNKVSWYVMWSIISVTMLSGKMILKYLLYLCWFAGFFPLPHSISHFLSLFVHVSLSIVDCCEGCALLQGLCSFSEEGAICHRWAVAWGYAELYLQDENKCGWDKPFLHSQKATLRRHCLKAVHIVITVEGNLVHGSTHFILSVSVHIFRKPWLSYFRKL